MSNKKAQYMGVAMMAVPSLLIGASVDLLYRSEVDEGQFFPLLPLGISCAVLGAILSLAMFKSLTVIWKMLALMVVTTILTGGFLANALLVNPDKREEFVGSIIGAVLSSIGSVGSNIKLASQIKDANDYDPIEDPEVCCTLTC